MSASVIKLSAKQEEAILALLAHQGVDKAAEVVGIAPRTLYRWMNESLFDRAYRKARRAAFGQGTGRLQQMSSAAVSTVLKILLDPKAPGIHAAPSGRPGVDARGEAIEVEDIDPRVAELERVGEETKRDR